MSEERHSTDAARSVKQISSGLPPGWIIPFGEIHIRLGLRKQTVTDWKREGLEDLICREGKKEFVFTDEVNQFLKQRWGRGG